MWSTTFDPGLSCPILVVANFLHKRLVTNRTSHCTSHFSSSETPITKRWHEILKYQEELKSDKDVLFGILRREDEFFVNRTSIIAKRYTLVDRTILFYSLFSFTNLIKTIMAKSNNKLKAHNIKWVKYKKNPVLLLRCNSILFRSRRERGTVGCVCKYMMCRVCLFMWITFVWEEIVCSFKSIKINEIQNKEEPEYIS